jgi:DNA processing protein
MLVNTLTLKRADFPKALEVIYPLPSQLFWSGISLDEVLSRPRVAIVGSRKATPYGRLITEQLGTCLARAGVVIISGLAYGIDSYAHRATIKAGGCTIAVLPTPLHKISPASHYLLAKQIIDSGGALLSEYKTEDEILKVNFIARNRIVSGLAEVLLITEAARNSGSLHTARFALEQGKTVMAVPGNINSPVSEGCNNLIKSGAIPVTSADDIFFALGMDAPRAKTAKKISGTVQQQQIFDLIANGIKDQEELAVASSLPVPEISSSLTTLELQGHVRPLGGGLWTIT